MPSWSTPTSASKQYILQLNNMEYTTMSILNTAGANHTSNNTNESADESLPFDNEDEFKARKEVWKRVANIVEAIFRLNVVLAVIFSVCGLILFLVMLVNKDVRGKSPLWYWLHIVLLMTFCGLGIHLPGYSEMRLDPKSFCLFIMYGAEYLLLLIPCMLILLNLEVLFLNILQVKYWQNKQVSRFIITVLLAWIFTAFVMGHLVIENNLNRRSNQFCVRHSKKIHEARLAVRGWTPASICFLSSAIILVTFCVQKSHPRFITAMTSLRGMTTSAEENRDKKSMMLMTLVMNATFILHVLLYLPLILLPKQFFNSPDNHILISVVLLFHIQTIYILPIPALFVPEVRSALRNTALRCFQILTGIYKGRVSEDSNTLQVRIGDLQEAA